MPHGAVPFPFGDCRICNDKATGVHYGVATCEGCKGFFKRSIPKGDKYKCFFGGQCILTPQNRNRCKACRFRRCLVSGMSVEAVKMGRIPKIDKERALEVARRKTIDKIQHHQMDNKMGGMGQPYLPMNMANHGSRGMSTDHIGHPYMDYNKHSALQSYHNRYDSHDTAQQMHSLTEGDRTLDMNMIPHPDALNMMQSSKMNSHNDVIMASDTTSSRSSSAHSIQGPYSPGVIKELFSQPMEDSDNNDQIMLQRFLHTVGSKNGCSNSDRNQRQYEASMLESQMQSYNMDRTYHNQMGYIGSQSWHSDDQIKSNSTNSHSTDSPLFEPNTYSVSAITHGPSSCTTSGYTSNASCSYVTPDNEGTLFGENMPTSSSEDQDVIDITQELDCYLQEIREPHLDVPAITSASSQLDDIQSSNGVTSLGNDNIDGKHLVPYIPSQDTKALVPSGISSGPDSTVSDSSWNQGEISMYKETMHKLTEAILMHDAFVQDTFDRMQLAIAGKMKPHPLNLITRATRPQIQEVWDSLMACIPDVNERIIGVVRMVPGFYTINSDDRDILVEYAYMDLWMILSARFFYNNDMYQWLPCGVRYSRFWMRHYLPESLVDSIFSFGAQLLQCQLTPTETAIVCAVQLTSPTRKGLKNLEKIKILHNHYLDLLAFEVPRNHGAKSSRVLIDIFRLLPLLEPINDDQNEIIMNFSVDHPPKGCLTFISGDDAQEKEQDSQTDKTSGNLKDNHDEITLSA